MSAMASQITSLTIGYAVIYSGTDYVIITSQMRLSDRNRDTVPASSDLANKVD